MIEIGILGPIGLGGGGGSQNLQQVTDVGNTTTNPINFRSGGLDFQILPALALSSSAVGVLPDIGGIFQVSGNGLFLPESTKVTGTYHPTRTDHVIFADVTAGGTLDVPLDAGLLAYPGLQIIVKIIGWGGVNPAIKIFPASGTIEGHANIKYSAINLFAVRIVNDGTNWWVLDVMTGAEIVSEISPTIATMAGAGAGATASIISRSSDNVGELEITFGAGTGLGVGFCQVTFARPWPTAPRGIFLQLASDGTTGTDVNLAGVFIADGTRTTAGFVISLPAFSNSPFDSTLASWMYTVIQ